MKTCRLLLPLLLSLPLVAQSLPEATLDIEVQKSAGKVSPTLYGLMTEEINHSYDGGLYAELVRNRSFHRGWDEPQGWFVVQNGNAKASMQMDATTGPSENRQLSLKVTVTDANESSTAGVANAGYWGIPVTPGTTYNASFYAKADGEAGPVTVAIVNDDTGRPVASGTVSAISAEWKQYKLQLRTGTVARSVRNRLVLTMAHQGTVWFDMVSLFPPTYKNRENGNRIDVMEKLAAMKPAFLRLPGGNYLEGDHIRDRFDWKKTIGPVVDRPGHQGPWNYWSTDGLGLLEFLEWCEDLHIKPVLAVYAGYSLRQEHVNPGADLKPYVQDALDELEYVTGDANTKWGAERLKGEHPAPFALDYVEIGNEDQFDKSGSYDGRFAQFYDAIKAQYPQFQLIATAAVKSRKPDVVDDHFYERADQFFGMTDHYDKADRNGPKIFVGEWATREGTPTPDFNAALADAAWMTGMERNSDLIVMSSYAPLLTNVNPEAMQWAPDLIGYDALNSYGSPSYYAQVLFSNHIGTEIVPGTLSGGSPRLFYSATRDSQRGLLYLKIVNASSEAQPLRIKLGGAAHIAATAKSFVLKAHSPAETNTLAAPNDIAPVSGTMPGISSDFRRAFAPYSITVLEIAAR